MPRCGRPSTRLRGGGGFAASDVSAPACWTGDTFPRGRVLPRCEAGDLVAIRATGAYGMSMASTFNTRPLAAEVLVDGDRYALVRRRQTFDELVAGEQPADSWSNA